MAKDHSGGVKKDFDKYYYYKDSVQSPENDAEFLRQTYVELRAEEPKSFREDFCGTFALCCEWVKLSDQNQAIGVDIDPEPTSYGKRNYLTELSDEQRERVNIHLANVTEFSPPSVDVCCALNFSYFIFKKREELKDYFTKVHNSLNDNGLFFMDCFGGAKCCEANEEETEDDEKGYSYFWDQDSFDPITNEAKFYIHFKRDGEARREKVFSYDWRMWSLPELRDILEEVGFSSSFVYWEGSDEDGEGNGIFERTDAGEECEAWVAYIVAAK